MKNLFSQILVFALCAALLVGCAIPPQNAATHQHSHEEHSVEIVPQVKQVSEVVQHAGGVLCLKINPEIAVHYDENGKVTKLEGRNADGIRLLENFTGYEGKETSQVLEQLVQLIGQAGYFVEEAEGKARKIVLELDPGSQVPHDKFLEDMAAHVKACVESKTWNGEREYDYPEPAPQQTTAPAQTEPAAPAATTPASKETTASTVPVGLCPVCADYDCDDGAKCDDADEKAENLKEYERLMSGKVCPTCADPDCDDGAKCDDADEKAENEKENEAKKKAATTEKTTAAKKTTTTPKKTTTTTKKTTTSSTVPAGLCPVCADDDCDDGAKCDDADEKEENLKEYNAKKKAAAAKQTTTTKKATTTAKKVTKCAVCGDTDCDDGKYCDDWDDRDDDDDDDRDDRDDDDDEDD